MIVPVPVVLQEENVKTLPPEIFARVDKLAAPRLVEYWEQDPCEQIVMYETMAAYPLSWLFYLSFIFLVAFIFLNMMIGIVLEVLQREHEEFDREHGQGEAGVTPGGGPNRCGLKTARMSCG